LRNLRFKKKRTFCGDQNILPKYNEEEKEKYMSFNIDEEERKG